ncbi:hypothetical protein, partial [Paenibacillus endophyticus]
MFLQSNLYQVYLYFSCLSLPILSKINKLYSGCLPSKSLFSIYIIHLNKKSNNQRFIIVINEYIYFYNDERL